MIAPRDLADLVLAPRAYVERVLPTTASANELVRTTVLPLAGVRSVAVLLRSLFEGNLSIGILLALASLALLLGTWFAVGLIVPTLARQAQAEISAPNAFGLVTLASIPLWVAGVLYVVPETAPVVYVWSRLAVLVLAAYGAYLLLLGAKALDIQPPARSVLVGLVVGAYLAVYGVLFALLGLFMLVIVFFSGSSI